MATKSVKIPLLYALGWIVLSVLLINGPIALGLFYYHKWKQLRCQDPKYHLVALVANCMGGQAMNHLWLAEKLSLSIDHPTHFDAFSIKEKERQLLSDPVFQAASVKKIAPCTVFVSYRLKEPVAFLADYENTAIDSMGVLFPFKPYFTPKKLPSIRLGEELEKVWGQKVKSEKLMMAFSLLEKLQKLLFIDVLLIDVSRMEASSAGRREIIIEVDERRNFKETKVQHSRRILRLSPDKALDGLVRYEKLLKHFEEKGFEKGKIIDLRLAHLAYLSS